MISITRTISHWLRSLIALLPLTACSPYTGIGERDLLGPNSPIPEHYSILSQSLIREVSLLDEELATPERLEESTKLQSPELAIKRDLLLAETYLNPSSGDTSGTEKIERTVRAAHFSYQGLLSEQCRGEGDPTCFALRASYSRAVLQLVQLTDKARHLPPADSSRYTLDLLGDGDPIDLESWDVDLTPPSAHQILEPIGAPAVGCRTNSDSSSPESPQICAPLAFIVTFEGGTLEERTHAHIVAFDTYKENSLNLHGRDLPLPPSIPAAWGVIFERVASEPGKLVCLSNPDPNLPVAILSLSTQFAQRDWLEIGSALTQETEFFNHYNFCAFVGQTLDGTEAAEKIRLGLLSISERQNLSRSVVLLSQGPVAEAMAKELKSIAHSRALTVVATLGIPPFPISYADDRVDISSAPHSMSPHAARALADIRRLLHRLIDGEEGVFSEQQRKNSAVGQPIKLSPVM
jgi:hypothetical protein